MNLRSKIMAEIARELQKSNADILSGNEFQWNFSKNEFVTEFFDITAKDL